MNENVERPDSSTVASGQDALVFARAALALAGHEVTEPYLIDLHEKMARGEISSEDVRRLTLERYICV